MANARADMRYTLLKLCVLSAMLFSAAGFAYWRGYANCEQQANRLRIKTEQEILLRSRQLADEHILFFHDLPADKQEQAVMRIRLRTQLDAAGMHDEAEIVRTDPNS